MRYRAEASGRFLLRVPPRLHAALRAAAEEAGVSLNEYCTRKLALPAEAAGDAVEAVVRAASLFGAGLRAVVLFGSFARGEEREASDVDLLVVLDDSVKISRGLYRQWDEAPLTFEGHRVEPHLVHLPSPDGRTGGLWGEVALDGVVLFACGRALSSVLSRIRRDIAEGRLVRRFVHGQPYWVEAA